MYPFKPRFRGGYGLGWPPGTTPADMDRRTEVAAKLDRTPKPGMPPGLYSPEERAMIGTDQWDPWPPREANSDRAARRHFLISMAKSALRLGAFALLAVYLPWVGGLLFAAELLGILEELVV